MNTRFLAVSVLAAAVTLSLAGCDSKDGRTVGQQIDATVSKVEQTTDKAVADIKENTGTVRADAGQAVDTATLKLKDAAITTAVNAELVRDKSLSATTIDVDTAEGRVALKGTAPDAAAKERATQLARAVDGVKSVDNRLQVAAK